MICRFVVFLAILAHVGCASSGRFRDEPLPTLPESVEDYEPSDDGKGWSKEAKFWAVQGTAVLAVSAYGLQFWDYGKRSFNIDNEGWFGDNTKYGGADKLGHAYATYLGAIGLATLYESWGYERDEADILGAVTAFTSFGLIEVGDALSKAGFSYEDLVADAVGAAYGYLWRRYPKLQKYLDYRVEYIPSDAVLKGGKNDLVTDYSGFKYLLALKLDAFPKLENTPLQWFEIHVGYFTRGFVNQDRDFYEDKTRRGYIGIGLNMSRILRKAGAKKVARVLNFYQLPYTYVAVDAGRERPR